MAEDAIVCEESKRISPYLLVCLSLLNRFLSFLLIVAADEERDIRKLLHDHYVRRGVARNDTRHCLSKKLLMYVWETAIRKLFPTSFIHLP